MGRNSADPMPGDLLVRDCRPMGGATCDLLVRDGRIVGTGRLDLPGGVEAEDGGNALLLPAPVEAHVHLDKSLWGLGWQPHSAGPGLADKIANESRIRRSLVPDARRHAGLAIEELIRHGSTRIRSHVDIDPVQGLAGFEALLAVRDDYADVAELQIVAFPQSGVMRAPGTLDLLEEALAGGADVVGGLDPCAIDRDPKGHLDAIFGLAGRHGKPVDIHLHEPGEMGAFSVELICERTRALGMAGQVAISHAFCLGSPDRDLVDGLIDKLRRLDIAVVTTGPAGRPAPPVARLRAAGVRVCGGSDNIRDAWSPYGNGDMLERAMLIGLRNDFRRDDDIETAYAACSSGGAAVLGAPDHGIAPGCRADFVLVEAETVAEAVVLHPARRLVVSAGRVVARDGTLLESVSRAARLLP